MTDEQYNNIFGRLYSKVRIQESFNLLKVYDTSPSVKNKRNTKKRKKLIDLDCGENDQ